MKSTEKNLKGASIFLITGQRIHKSQPIPANAIVFLRNNRECYVSGLSHNNVRLRYLEDGSFEDLGWNEGGLYLPCCNIPEANVARTK